MKLIDIVKRMGYIFGVAPQLFSISEMIHSASKCKKKLFFERTEMIELLQPSKNFESIQQILWVCEFPEVGMVLFIDLELWNVMLTHIQDSFKKNWFIFRVKWINSDQCRFQASKEIWKITKINSNFVWLSYLIFVRLNCYHFSDYVYVFLLFFNEFKYNRVRWFLYTFYGLNLPLKVRCFLENI